MTMMRAIAACCLGAVIASFTGCGSSHPETAVVTGSVTIDGQPVTEGRVTFYPESGRPAIGAIGPDGTYSLTTWDEGDGAIPGKHQVTIKATRSTGTAPASFEDELKGGGGQGGAVEWLVPEKYSRRTTTPLSKEVVTGTNTIDFALTSSD